MVRIVIAILLIGIAGYLFAAPPAPVEILSVTSTNSTLEVTRAPLPDGIRVTGAFKFDRAQGGWRRFKAGTPFNTQNLTWSDSDVILGREYCYRLTVQNSNDERTVGSMVCGVFNGGDASVRPPSPAERVGILENRSHFQLFSFTDGSDNETGFEVMQTIEGNPVAEPIASFPASEGTGGLLQVAVDSVDMRVNYCYRVRSLNDHGSTLSNARCARTPQLEATPPNTNAAEGPQPYAMGQQFENYLSVSWFDPSRFSARRWSVWLYTADDLSTPVASKSIQDHRSSRPTVFGTIFTPLAGGQLYCARVTRQALEPDDSRPLCESPRQKRRFAASQIGPTPDALPTIIAVDPVPGGINVTIDRPRENQLLDVLRDDRKRFTELGARDGRRTHEITDLNPEHQYCLRTWVYNFYGSRYDDLICATPLPVEEPEPTEKPSVTYSTQLRALIPQTGLITYLHVVEPGLPRPVHLVRVRVIGNAFARYKVRFLTPGMNPPVCSLSAGDGVTVSPGDTLSESGLQTLFGSASPVIPANGLALLACKLLDDPASANIDAIPVDVTYRRD